jgi:hypothetical protein
LYDSNHFNGFWKERTSDDDPRLYRISAQCQSSSRFYEWLFLISDFSKNVGTENITGRGIWSEVSAKIADMLENASHSPLISRDMTGTVVTLIGSEKQTVRFTAWNPFSFCPIC